MRWRARRRIFWFMRFSSQMESSARLRSRASFMLLSLPSLRAGKYGTGIVDATRILIWSSPCTNRFAIDDLVLRSSSFSGTMMSPLARLRTWRICCRTGPCASLRCLYSSTISSTLIMHKPFCCSRDNITITHGFYSQDGRHIFGGFLIVVRLGRLSTPIHRLITMSVPFFLSRCHEVSSSTAASVFQLPRIVGNRIAPVRKSGGSRASTPRFSSSLFLPVVWATTLTDSRVCHLRTKSCARRNR